MRRFITLVALGMFVGSIFYACQQDTLDPIPEEKEFVARNKDFENFRTWTILAKSSEKHPSFAATTHANNEAGSARWIYVKDNVQRGADGKYPVGTVIVKEYRKADGTPMDITNVFYTAMVKRGKSFNPDFGDWEWFQIDPKTLKIRVAAGGVNAEYRGADLFSNSCSNCHNGAKDKDFVFSAK